jgi:dihydroorotase (multifunctional complex type)
VTKATTTQPDIAVTGGRVVIPPVGIFEADLLIEAGRIAGIVQPGQARAKREIDARGRVVLPGVIDPHTHIGYAGHRGMPLDALPSQYDTESASAVIGGVTTLINTYRNERPYTEIFDEMRRAGEENSRIDFSYSLGILNDAQVREIPDYYQEYGISSFKFYMSYRGVDAAASGNASNRYDDGLLYQAMLKVADIPGGMVMVHPENIDIIDRVRSPIEASGREDLAAWSESRPDFAEAENIRRALYLGEQANCPVYIPHLSCAKGLAVCREHRLRNTNKVFVEVCPHHLTLTKHSDLGLLGKVNPPLREAADGAALWEGLRDGTVDAVGSDHAGVTRALKGPTIWQGAPGFAGTATLLPILLNAVHEKRCSLVDVAMATAYGPARCFNLLPRKGTLMVGSDADLAIVDLDHIRRPTPEYLRSSADYTVYEGCELRGWPVLTMVRGEVHMQDGELVGQPGWGRYQPRFAAT